MDQANDKHRDSQDDGPTTDAEAGPAIDRTDETPTTVMRQSGGDQARSDDADTGGAADEAATTVIGPETGPETDDAPTRDATAPTTADESTDGAPTRDAAADVEPTTGLPVLPGAGRPASTPNSPDAATERVPLPNLPSSRRLQPSSAEPPESARTETSEPRPGDPTAGTTTDTANASADDGDTRTVGPQRIEPSSTGKRSRKPLLLVGALVLLLVLAGGGFWLYQTFGANSDDNQIREAVTAYADGLRDGDLGAVREGTCGDLAQFYAGIDDADFAAIREDGERDGSIPRVDSIDAIRLDTEDSAIVAATVSTSDESAGSTRTFDMRREDGQWKVCG